MRPLAMDFRTMYGRKYRGPISCSGPAILVNLVTDSEAMTRHLYLPKAKWYYFDTGKVAEGGAIDAIAPLDRITALRSAPVPLSR